MKKAESQGLTFRSEVDLDGHVLTTHIADSCGDFMYGSYALIHNRFTAVSGRLQTYGTMAAMPTSMKLSMLQSLIVGVWTLPIGRLISWNGRSVSMLTLQTCTHRYARPIQASVCQTNREATEIEWAPGCKKVLP